MLIKDAATIIANEYYRLRAAWFVGANVPAPARLRFLYLPEDGDDATKYAPADWGYDHVPKILQCVIQEADLADEGLAVGGMIDFNADAGETNEGMYDDGKLVGWAYWRWNLVHELCHEYEHEILKGVATLAGWQLFHAKCTAPNQPPKWTPYYKHPVAFYSAVAAFAQTFGLTASDLHDTI
jgi:hypothetical protein